MKRIESSKSVDIIKEDRSKITIEEARARDLVGDVANVYRHGNDVRVAMYHREKRVWRWPLADITPEGFFKLHDFSDPSSPEHDFDDKAKWDGLRIYSEREAEAHEELHNDIKERKEAEACGSRSSTSAGQETPTKVSEFSSQAQAAMKFAVIVPTCRPDSIPRIITNWARQVWPLKRLVVVENGEAVGASEKHSLKDRIPDAVVVQSPAHVSMARNAGIEAALEHFPEAPWLTTFDDDDWYGQHYLVELAAEIAVRGERFAYGKAVHFSMMGSHGFCLFAEELQNSFAGFLHGPTICVHRDTLGDRRYDQSVRVGEDMKLCELFRQEGIPMRRTSIYNYAYLRGEDSGQHTWNTSNDTIKALLTQCGTWYKLGATFRPEIADGRIPWHTFAKKQGRSPLLQDRPLVPINVHPASGPTIALPSFVGLRVDLDVGL